MSVEMENGMMKSVVFACAASAAALVCRAEVSVTNRELVADSPFELRIGSTEYAKMLGDAVSEHTGKGFDPELGEVVTNYVHRSATLRLRRSYFGFERMVLSFRGKDKKLETIHAHPADVNRKKLSMKDCLSAVEKIAADIDSRLGVDMAGSMQVSDEADAIQRLEKLRTEIADENKTGKSRAGEFATSFCSARATKEIAGVDVDFDVTGFVNNMTNCYVSLSIERYVDRFGFSPGRSNGRIPVYTNSATSAAMSLPVSEEQKKAHEEAAKIRAALKRLFGVDFDERETPIDTQRLPDPEKSKDLMSKPEWSAMETPFAGMTERKQKQAVKFMFIPLCSFALRRAYDSDVSEDELQSCASTFVAAFEAELGEKIPPVEAKDDLEKMVGSGVPAFGDVRAILQSDKRQAFTGRVGDILMDVSYAPPRYVKKDGRYEISRRGAVVVSFTQSPLCGADRSGAERRGNGPR